MTALIFKYNLTDQQWCDNRTVEETFDELAYDGRTNEIYLAKTVQLEVCKELLRGGCYKKENIIYALSKSAIEEYIKEKK